jgi:hypothetical protein
MRKGYLSMEYTYPADKEDDNTHFSENFTHALQRHLSVHHLSSPSRSRPGQTNYSNSITHLENWVPLKISKRSHQYKLAMATERLVHQWTILYLINEARPLKSPDFHNPKVFAFLGMSTSH